MEYCYHHLGYSCASEGQRQHVQSEGADKDWGHDNGG